MLAAFAIKLPDSSASCSMFSVPLLVKDPETVNFPSFEIVKVAPLLMVKFCEKPISDMSEKKIKNLVFIIFV